MGPEEARKLEQAQKRMALKSARAVTNEKAKLASRMKAPRESKHSTITQPDEFTRCSYCDRQFTKDAIMAHVAYCKEQSHTEQSTVFDYDDDQL